MNATTMQPPGFAFGDERQRYLGARDFARMLLAALALHGAVLAAILLWPEREAPLPVRSLTITFAQEDGRGDEPPLAELAPLPEPAAAPAPAFPAFEPVPEPKPVPKPKPAPKAAPKPEPKPKPEAKPEPPSQSQITAPPTATAPTGARRVRIGERRPPAQQHIPANVPVPITLPKVWPPVERIEAMSALPTNPSGGELARNPYQYARPRPGSTERNRVTVGPAAGQSDAETIKARYEQKISAWLQQHRIYPPMAKQLGQHGQPVLRLRIDRSGDVKFFTVDRPTGYQLIDEAALDMVRRASPFPAPPEDYPGGAMLEFLIPVKFDLR